MSSATSPDFTIVDERDDYVVVDKSPFLLAHPTKPNGEVTLWKKLQELLAFELANGGQVSIINRLDRETSGLVLIAKTAAAARRYGMLMQQRRLKKEYLAIVWGWPEWETRFIEAPLVRQGKHRESAIWLKQAIHPAGLAEASDPSCGSGGANRISRRTALRKDFGWGRTAGPSEAILERRARRSRPTDQQI